MTEFAVCTIAGCGRRVTKPNHTLCLTHWKAMQSPSAAHGKSQLTAKELGPHFDLSGTQINRVLAELGWIEKAGDKGWKPSSQGIKLCAEAAVHMGNAYVRWPEGILSSRILRHAIAAAKGEGDEGTALDSAPSLAPATVIGAAPVQDRFRGKFPANHWATDGHAVRSKGEMLIDNWLYYSGLVHAYERRLPIEEEVYCDFFLPQGKVYIEYWGLDDINYLVRKEQKRSIYRSNDLNLIELDDKQVKNLDDEFPKLLRKFGITVD